MGAAGFPRASRLLKAREFDAVFKQAAYRASSAEFLVLAVDNGAEKSRIGMVVSKKVSGSSVDRNRIRRLIREAFRTRFTEPGLDLVVVARTGVRRRSNNEILEILEKLWLQLSDKHRRPRS